MLTAKQRSSATLIGYIGVFFWAFSAIFNVVVRRIPTFEIIMFAYGTACVAILARVAWRREWHKFKQPLILWLVGILGVYGNDVFYIAAFKQIPAVQADLINYLWPVGVILFSGFLPREKHNAYHVAAGLFALIGIYILITDGHGLGGFNPHYFFGYGLALCGVASWCVFVLVSRYYPNVPVEMIGVYCGIGALLSIAPHMMIEKFVMPTGKELMMLITIGLTSQGLAYVLWEIGVKRGNFVLLSVLAYGNPILSVLLLVIFGVTHLTVAIAAASVLVTFAGLLASFDGSIHGWVKKLSERVKESTS
jgi:drug/metabolite transporter (DMT)-like permease